MKKLFILFIITGILLLPMPGRILHADISDEVFIDIGGQTYQGTEEIFGGLGEGIGAAIGCSISFIACGIGATLGKELGKLIGGLFGGGPDIEQLFQNKEYKEDPRERKVAADLLRKMQNNILTTLRTGGPGGKPTWVTDWRHFVRDQQDDGRAAFRVQIYDAALGKNATICAYLADDIANKFQARPNEETFGGQSNEYYRIDAEQPFNLIAACTLPDTYDHEAYLRGEQFSLDLFLKKLEPQNNSIGLWYLSESEKQHQGEAEARVRRENAVANGGNLGIDGEGRAGINGTVLNQIGAKALTSNLDWYVSSDEIGEVVFDANGRVQAQLGDFTLSINALDDPRVDSKREPLKGISRFLIKLISDAVSSNVTQDKLDKIQQDVGRIQANTSPSPRP